MTIQHLNLVWLLIYSLIATKPFGIYGFNVKLFPVDRFDKALFPENPTLGERYQRTFNTSRASVHQLELSMVSPSSMEWKDSIGHGPRTLKPVVTKHPIFRYYITSVKVGTSSYVANLILDTNSDDTWIQCQGCTTCFPLRQGNFDKSKSQTYRPLPCEHPLCVPRICKNGSCAYHVKYPSYNLCRCYSEGQVSLDTFIFQDDHNSTREFHQTAFGCGLDNEVLHWGRLGENNTVSGVLGLGAGKRSILTQYVNETKRRISYCLPSWSSREGTHTLLSFGDDARMGGHPGSTVQTTALVDNVNRYTVNLTGISINGNRIDLHPRALGGMRIDTGSPDTILNEHVYDAVKAKITHYFYSKYSWLPKPFQPGKFDVCYAVPQPHEKYIFPTMTYHFPGADLFLPSENVFRFYASGFCMMIMYTSIGGPTLLGSFQQTNHRFLFDFERLTASFVPEVCEVH